MDFKGMFLNMDFDPFLTNPPTQIWKNSFVFLTLPKCFSTTERFKETFKENINVNLLLLNP